MAQIDAYGEEQYRQQKQHARCAQLALAHDAPVIIHGQHGSEKMLAISDGNLARQTDELPFGAAELHKAPPG